MNSNVKKMSLIGFALLLSACDHYSRSYAYYPGPAAYSSGYTIMHRNYYGERPDYYHNDYGSDRAYFSHRHGHELHRWGKDYSEHRHQHHQHEGNQDQAFKHPNDFRHEGGDNRHNNFDHKNHHRWRSDR